MHKRLGIGREENPEDMSVKSLYQNEVTSCRRSTPSEIIIGADSIDLEIKIFEGRPFTINEVSHLGQQPHRRRNHPPRASTRGRANSTTARC